MDNMDRDSPEASFICGEGAWFISSNPAVRPCWCAQPPGDACSQAVKKGCSLPNSTVASARDADDDHMCAIAFGFECSSRLTP